MKPNNNSVLERKIGLRLSYSLALVTLLVTASAFLPEHRSAASSRTRRGVSASARVPAKPLPPVRVCTIFDDEIEIEGGGAGPITCGGSSCQHQSMYCTQNNVYIMMVSGCCAKCCVNGTENCSDQTCCDPR